MSQNPESVPFVRWALQISRTDKLWSTLARHAAVDKSMFNTNFNAKGMRYPLIAQKGDLFHSFPD